MQAIYTIDAPLVVAMALKSSLQYLSLLLLLTAATTTAQPEDACCRRTCMQFNKVVACIYCLSREMVSVKPGEYLEVVACILIMPA